MGPGLPGGTTERERKHIQTTLIHAMKKKMNMGITILDTVVIYKLN